jgi:hypothetical protein
VHTVKRGPARHFYWIAVHGTFDSGQLCHFNEERRRLPVHLSCGGAGVGQDARPALEHDFNVAVHQDREAYGILVWYRHRAFESQSVLPEVETRLDVLDGEDGGDLFESDVGHKSSGKRVNG